MEIVEFFLFILLWFVKTTKSVLKLMQIYNNHVT